jgi:hypothetical protein
VASLQRLRWVVVVVAPHARLRVVLDTASLCDTTEILLRRTQEAIGEAHLLGPRIRQLISFPVQKQLQSIGVLRASLEALLPRPTRTLL